MFDPNSRELTKYGVRVHLHDQPVQVLATLLARPGEVVTREELRQQLWQSGTFVDFENGLNSAVNRLREALCDSAKMSRYIETIPRHGYRFIASVSSEPSESATESCPASEPGHAGVASSASHFDGSRLVVAAGIFALVALMPFAAWHSSRRSTATLAISRPAKPVPLVTFADGSQWLPAFSPDGLHVAYAFQAATGWYLEMKDVGTDARLRLTQHPASFPPGPAWSPDGRQIAFARAGVSDDRGIFLISAVGGPEKKLRSLAAWPVPQRLISWSPDGQWIAFADEVHSDSEQRPGVRGPNAIYLISPGTLETRQLTNPAPGDFGDAAPTFSPDGTVLAFVRTNVDSHDEIYTVPFEGGTPSRLVTDGIWTNGLAWTQDGTSIVFDRSFAGGFQLCRVSSTGGKLSTIDLPSTNINILEPAVWRDRLAFESHETHETVGRIALNASHPELPATSVASTRRETAGRYSPDGERIAFLSDRTGTDELWMTDSDGANPIQLTHLGIPLVDLSWDPTGSAIAVSATCGKVFLVQRETQSVRVVFAGLPFADEHVPNIAFSRNGNFLYVLSQPGAGVNYELLKVPISGGAPVKVMDGRLTNFAESMDGSTLFYSHGRAIWKRPSEGGAEQFVAPTSDIWDVRSDGLYLLTDSSSIERYSFDGKRLSRVATLDHFDVKFPMSISPDARWALLGYRQRQTVEIDMIQHFD